MTRDERVAAVERAELERWYRLPSPVPVPETPRPVPSQPALLLLWVSVAVMAAVYVRGVQ